MHLFQLDALHERLQGFCLDGHILRKAQHEHSTFYLGKQVAVVVGTLGIIELLERQVANGDIVSLLLAGSVSVVLVPQFLGISNQQVR